MAARPGHPLGMPRETNVPGRVAGLTAAGRAGGARAVFGIIDVAAPDVAGHRAEVDDVPDAAPGDQGRDAERADLPVLAAVDDSHAGDVPVPDGAVAGAHRDP